MEYFDTTCILCFCGKGRTGMMFLLELYISFRLVYTVSLYIVALESQDGTRYGHMVWKVMD